MTFKISLGMIVRDEARTLRQCLESIAPFVDEIVIGLGGESSDDTEAIAREFTDNIIPIEWTSDFSAARNQILDAVTGDYFFWIDGDDIVLGGEHLKELVISNPNVDGFYMGYDYARDEEGNNVCFLIRERLVRLHDELPNRGWRWLGKIHEVLARQGFDEVSFHISNVVIQHHKPPNKHSPNRNIDILYSQLEEQEPSPDPRILGYLCTENAGRGNFREAILHGQRFIKLSGWLEERYQMQHRIADMYRVLGLSDKAIDADMDAIQMVPDWPDAWFGLAETYSSVENWKAVVEYTKAGASHPAPQTMLIINPLDYSFFPVIVLAGAYAHLGDFEMALANYQKAYEVKPVPTIAHQIDLLNKEINLQNITKAFLTLREHLGRNDEWLKVRKLYDVVPKHIEQHPTIQETWERSMIQTAHVLEPSIMVDFYTGNPHWTPVNDDQIKDPGWLDYPRMRFALDTARKIDAKNIVDWGCSDGFIALPLARETGAHVTGFDLDPRCVDLATVRAKEWGVDARFQVGNVDEIGGWDGPKADLAIFFEVIEHVVDPSKTLERIEKTANRIIMTTPYLSWEDGQLPAWDRLEPKGHLRIFDQYDIERILTPRGRIWNLYRQPWANTGWLFVDYTPGERHDKNIMIGAMGAPEPWNPRIIDSKGLGGSETAVVRLAEAFARQGHRPIVYSNVDEPGYYNGACYRDASHFRTEIESDIYIAWRAPEQADWEINTKQLVLWMHDTDAGDRLTPSRARKFDAIVVLTEWHKKFMLEKYPFLKEEKLVVIGNGVDFSRFEGKVKRDSKRVIYSSSPDRGLDVILEGIWPKVVEAVPDAELHVYYGWNNFDKFAPMYPQLQAFKQRVQAVYLESKNVIQHGRVSQKELAEAFQKSAVWLYPTYFTETYCITAIEAQLGGAVPVTNDLAGLSETVRSGAILSQDVRDPKVQEDYAQAVINLLSTPDSRFNKIVRQNAPAQSWDQVAALWRQHFLQEGEVIRG
jgi:glycosyltransferase involved in cell wall biosynthesis